MKVCLVAARLILGVVFVYLGLTKALQPVDFLKFVREYGVFEHHVALNFVAAVLPWFEVFCGILLIVGVAVRGTALVLLGLLLCFSGLVVRRAWSIHEAQSIGFCAVRFNCGCGSGEVLICGKLLENAALSLISLVVLFGQANNRATKRGVGPAQAGTGRSEIAQE